MAELCDGGDTVKGKNIFVSRCAMCHAIDKELKEKIGPNLYGVIDRQTGQSSGFDYTDAMKSKGITWNRETLFAFLENPKKYIPGTKMVFAGLKKTNDRSNVIAFIENECTK